MGGGQVGKRDEEDTTQRIKSLAIFKLTLL